MHINTYFSFGDDKQYAHIYVYKLLVKLVTYSPVLFKILSVHSQKKGLSVLFLLHRLEMKLSKYSKVKCLGFSKSLSFTIRLTSLYVGALIFFFLKDMVFTDL